MHHASFAAGHEAQFDTPIRRRCMRGCAGGSHFSPPRLLEAQMMTLPRRTATQPLLLQARPDAWCVAQQGPLRSFLGACCRCRIEKIVLNATSSSRPVSHRLRTCRRKVPSSKNTEQTSLYTTKAIQVTVGSPCSTVQPTHIRPSVPRHGRNVRVLIRCMLAGMAQRNALHCLAPDSST